MARKIKCGNDEWSAKPELGEGCSAAKPELGFKKILGFQGSDANFLGRTRELKLELYRGITGF